MSDTDVIDLEQGWAVIHGGFLKLIKKVEGGLNTQFIEFHVSEYMEVYRTVYKLCTQKSPHHYPQQAYDKYREAIDEYITVKLFPALDGDYGEFTLEEVAKIWENYKLILQLLSNLFNYLDRYFVRKESLPSLTQVGITAFRERVYQSLTVIATDVVIRRIDRERDGEEIDKAPLKSVVDIFVETGLDLYKSGFEEILLENTRSYYSRKAEVWISELSLPEYLIKVDESFVNEANRVEHYLHSSSREKLAGTVRNELLSSHRTALLENEHSGFRVLLRDYKKEDISRLARLFSEVPEGFESAVQIFQDYLTKEGIALIEGVNIAVNTDTSGRDIIDILTEQEFVSKIVAFHQKALFVVTGPFNNHDLFQKALREAFEVVCNKRTGGLGSSELFATLFSSVLKNGNHVTGTIENLAALLKYIYEKDAFIKFYKRKLVDRLLFDRSSDLQDENTLLSFVKRQFREGFVAELEALLNDFVRAGETQDRFKQYIDNSGSNLGIDVTVTALRDLLWRSYKSAEFIPPLQLVEATDVFDHFYSELYGNRILRWVYSLGSANVIVQFDEKPIEIIASTYQASVILLFSELEDSQKLSFEEIKSRTKLEDAVLKSVLQSLVFDENYKILLKEPDNKTIAPTDRFELNLKFTNILDEIKIPFQRPQVEEKKVTRTLEADRRQEIKAALVRIMKKAKVLPREKLLSDCAEAVLHRFKPTVQLMDEEIKNLFNSDLLEPGEGDDIKYVD